MKYHIYQFPTSVDTLQIDSSNVNFEKHTSPKLIKYGFNDLADKLDIVSLKSNEQYKTGLMFDFDRNDKESIVIKAKESMNIKKMDQIFAELWEIIALFGFFNKDQKILTTHPDIVKNIFDTYQKMTKTKLKFEISDKFSDKVDLIIKKYSDTIIDENVHIDIIYDDLKNLMEKQSSGSNLILQINGTQTQITAEMLYYLSNLYNNSYIIKPSVISNLSDEKYLVLLGLKEEQKLSLPKIPKDMYLSSLNIKIPNSFVVIIQCLNGELIPKKIETYFRIKSYVDNKIYDGIIHDEMIARQNKNTNQWLQTFSDLPMMETYLQNALKESQKNCDNSEKWNNLLNMQSDNKN